MTAGRSVETWKARGFNLHRLSELVEPRAYSDEDVITKDHPDQVQVLVVRYEGVAEAGEEILPSEGSYARLYPIRAGDIVISNIAASHGSIAVVPEELDGYVVSSEYTVLSARPSFDPQILQLIIRSPEVRADLLLSASGANRTRTRWDLMSDLMIPYPSPSTVAAVKQLIDAWPQRSANPPWNLKRRGRRSRLSLLLRSDVADTILAAFRPPK